MWRSQHIKNYASRRHVASKNETKNKNEAKASLVLNSLAGTTTTCTIHSTFKSIQQRNITIFTCDVKAMNSDFHVGEIPKNPNLFYSYKCPSIFKMTKCLYALHAYLTCLHFRFWKQLPACSEDALSIRCGCTNARWCAWWMWKKTMANNICLANDLQHEIVVLYATLSMTPPVGPTLHTYNI